MLGKINRNAQKGTKVALLARTFRTNTKYIHIISYQAHKIDSCNALLINDTISMKTKDLGGDRQQKVAQQRHNAKLS